MTADPKKAARMRRYRHSKRFQNLRDSFRSQLPVEFRVPAVLKWGARLLDIGEDVIEDQVGLASDLFTGSVAQAKAR